MSLLFRILSVGCLLLLLFSSKAISAQNLSKVTYAINSPLKTNTIYDVYFSSQNLLYIATDNGLWTYDGLEFFQCKHSIEYSSRLNNIQESVEGLILVCDFNGNVFAIQNDSLIKKELSIEAPIKSFLVKGAYTYFIGFNTIYAQNNSSQKITPITISTKVKSILNFSKKGVFYVNTDDEKVYLGQLKDTTLTLLELEHPVRRFHNDYGEDCAVFDNNNHLINTKGDTIVNLAGVVETLSPFRLKKIQGQAFLACKEGLYLSNQQQLFLKGEFVTNVVEDQEHNLWVSTVNKGLHKISDLKHMYYPVKSRATEVDLVFVHNDHVIYSDKVGKLYHWDKQLQTFKLFHECQLKGQLKNIFFDPKKKEYVFSGNQIVFFDKDLRFLKRVPGYGRISLDDQYRFWTSRTDLIAFGEWGKDYPHSKINYIESTLTSSTFYDSYQSIKEDILLLKVNSQKPNKGMELFEDKVIMASNDSLLFIAAKDCQIKQMLPIPSIQSLYVKENRLFVVTTTQLVEMNGQGEILGVIERSKDLKNRITSIDLQEQYLVLTTKNGVHLLDAKTFEWLHKYTTKNGIVSLDFDKAWVYQDHLYVNGANGISTMYLGGKYSKGKVSIALQKVLANQIPIEKTALEYNENALELIFKVRSYTASGQLKWRLNGKTWRTNQVGNKRIYLEGLQPNSYQIEAYFESDLGVVSEVIKYDFFIKKPYWQTWWFYALIYLGIGGAIAAAVGQRLYNKRKAEKLKGQNDLLKMKALQAQMNPHFIFNIQAAIQGLWLRGNEAAALALQNKFSKLLRKIFQYSGYFSISMEQLLEFIENYIDLEQIRFKEKVVVDISIDPILLEEDYFIPPLLVQPIIENSFKHGLLHREGGGAQLTIAFQKDTCYLYCIIEDNGIGRQPNNPVIQNNRNASGLKTTQARLDLLQQSVLKKTHPYHNIKITDLKDVNNQAVGTKVELWIPFVAFQEAI